MADIDEIKARIDLAAFCERRWGVRFQYAGRGRKRALCPLHQEKTPSFVVYDDGGWWCFGALASFSEEDRRVYHRRRSEREILGQAMAIFERWLWETPDALAYCRGRGWTDETIRAHHLGYSRDAGTLRRELAAVGLDAAGRAANTAASIPNGMLIYPHIEQGQVRYEPGPEGTLQSAQ